MILSLCSKTNKGGGTSVNTAKRKMRKIVQINVWKSSKNETRIYVSFSDKSQGCYYKSGNNYQRKGLLENISEIEKSEALLISSKIHGHNVWGTVYQNQIENSGLIKSQIITTQNWEAIKMNEDLKMGYPINCSDYLNM